MNDLQPENLKKWVDSIDGRFVTQEELKFADWGENDNLLKILRDAAIKCNPKYGDILYPLEVLGIYKFVNNSTWFDVSYENPETLIDKMLTEWLLNINTEIYVNNLMEILNNNMTVKNIFLIRLNYAYLLEPGIDKIEIHYNRKPRILNAEELDAESEELLEQRENEFCENGTIINMFKTGTDQSFREIIHNALQNYGYEINTDLNVVYYELNKLSHDNVEEFLISRLAYLAMESEYKKEHKKLT